jgi:hypothetical protein
MKILNSITNLVTMDHLGAKSSRPLECTREVQFISTKLFNRNFNEHYETKPFFCELAKTNDIKRWQQEGVHIDVSNSYQRPKISLNFLFNSTAWTDQEYISPIRGSFNDDDFCGFS